MSNLFRREFMLTLKVPIPQNDQTQSNNFPTNYLSVFDHFVGLSLKGLSCAKISY